MTCEHAFFRSATVIFQVRKYYPRNWGNLKFTDVVFSFLPCFKFIFIGDLLDDR